MKTPSDILSTLESLRRRVRLLSLGYGLGLVVSTAAALLLGIVLLDYLLNLPPWPRVIGSVVAGAIVVYALLRRVLLPAGARLALSDLAGKVETVFPVFEDRLRAVVEFSDRVIPGSDAMKQRVIAQAGEIAAAVDFRNAIVARPTILSIASGAGAVLLIWLLASGVAPDHARVAAARLFSPFENHPWPKRQRIDLLAETPDRLPVGQRLEVKMRLGQGDRSSLRALLYSQIGDGPVQQQYMIRAPDGTYSAAVDTQVPDLQGNPPLKVWIRSGDDERHLPPVTLVQRLAILKAEARVTPPPYVSHVPAALVNLSAAPVVAVVGSTIDLAVEFNKPVVGPIRVEPVAANAETREPILAGDQQTGHVRAVRLPSDQSMKFRIRGRDVDGFENTAVEEFELIVRPDQIPTIQIENPRRNEERTAQSVIPLVAVAEDDFGISHVALHVERLGDGRKWVLPLVSGSIPATDVAWIRDASSTDRQRLRLGYSWDLAQLPDARLQSGDVLEFYLEAADNFSLGEQVHQPAVSGRLRISIITQEELANRVTDDMRLVRGQVAEVASAQARLRAETVELAEETRDLPALDPGQRATGERLANQQSTAASQARQLSQRLQQVRQRLQENRSPRNDLVDLAEGVAESLDRTAEGPMKDAARQLSEASQAQQPADARRPAMDRAQQAQEQAAQQLQGAMDRLGDLGSLQQSLQSVRRLLEEQQKLSEALKELGKTNLGKRPEQMSADDRRRLNELAAQQSRLAERSAATIADLQKGAEQLEKSDSPSAEAMRQAATAGQQQQVPATMQRAAQQARQNQQTGAQSAQRQAELGLQLMLQSLREAEKRKLAELQKELADIQKQINNLIRRQAGHNLDNLQLQGPDRVGAVDPGLIALLLSKSQRKPETPRAELGQLSAAQEQTERNARDLARQTEAMPNAAELATRLIRAAGRMERANVQLRRQDLPAAYDPPQVEALAALEEARSLAEGLKQEVDQKIDQQRREQLRAVYQRVHEAQIRLNAETARIDASDRREDGRLKREEALRLGQLPAQQASLAEQIAALEDRLAELESIVYVWANQDIVRAMGRVKDRLSAEQTGRATQAEQERSARQRQRMMQSLQENPIQSRFAQDSAGAGGPSA
ncbi:MAG: hypothetical protein NZ561_11945, partial [Phycisphaerae bacterium]|nr:hypothetical protein [Phycisphaerae bacterium]